MMPRKQRMLQLMKGLEEYKGKKFGIGYLATVISQLFGFRKQTSMEYIRELCHAGFLKPSGGSVLVVGRKEAKL